MNDKFLSHFETELRHLREVCAEFAANNRKVASELDISDDPRHLSRDPYVNMLLQGTAFMAARVHHKLDSEFPKFTQSLLEVVCPQFLCPTPSMAIVKFLPEASNPALSKGFSIPRHTLLRGQLIKGERSACLFRTAHEVDLWPVALGEVAYFTSRNLEELGLPHEAVGKAALRIRLEANGGLQFSQIGGVPSDGGKLFDRLVLHVRDDGNGPERGPGRIASAIMRQIFARTSSMVMQWGKGTDREHRVLPRTSVKRVGFDHDEALLPIDERSFSGFRLIREYFALPDRFMFFAISNLAAFLRDCNATSVDLVLLFSEEEPWLEGNEVGSRDQKVIDRDRFCLYSTPCVNLFEREFDRVALTDRVNEYAVVPDKSLQNEFEVYSLSRVTGYGIRPEERREFMPFYSSYDHRSTQSSGYFVTYREPRTPTEREKRFGEMPDYLGSEMNLSLVDPISPPWNDQLKQLGFRGLCTNRGLPSKMPRGLADTDFTPVDLSGPFSSEIRCLTGPTQPSGPTYSGTAMWDLIQHLSLNYLSMGDRSGPKAAAALRAALGMYVDERKRPLKRQIEGLLSLAVRPIVRLISSSGPMTFARGVEVRLDVDEDAFSGSSVFVLGMVLDEFFGRYVSMNSFVETVISSGEDNEIVRWAPRAGIQQLI